MTDLLVRVGLSSVLLTVGAAAAERALRELGRPRRGVWAVSLLATVAMTLLLATGGSLPLSAPAVVVQVVAGGGSAAPGTAEVPGTTGFGVGLLLVASWVVLSAALFLALALTADVLRRRVSRGERRRIEGIEVVVTEHLGPAVAGLLRPRIVVPAWLLDLTGREQGLVVRHEAEHAAAGDHALSVGALVLCCLVPWNPLAWYQLHRLRLAVELDCDARVLRADAGARRDYGRLLIDVAERMARGTPLATALIHPRGFLERRIRMLGRHSIRPLPAAAWALGALALIVAACSDVTEPAPGASEFSYTEPTAEPKVSAGTLRPLGLASEREQAASATDGAPAVEGQSSILQRRAASAAENAAIERTVGGETVSRFEFRDPEYPPASSRVVRFEMQLGEDGRAANLRFEPGTPEELQPRAREALEPIRFKRSVDAETGEWTHGVVTLP